MSRSHLLQAVLSARLSPRPSKTKTRNGRSIVVPSESIDTQLDRMRSYCAAMGWPVAGEYADPEASGATMDREGLQEALAHVCRIRGVLVVYSLSRLSRESSDALAIEKRLRRSKARLVSLSERIDTTTPSGRFAFAVFAAAQQYEREVTAQRTSDSMRYKQSKGARVSALPPFGYTVDPADAARLIEVPEQQAAIRDVLKLHECGESSRRAIARAVNAQHGCQLSHVMVKKILSRAESNETLERWA